MLRDRKLDEFDSSDLQQFMHQHKESECAHFNYDQVERVDKNLCIEDQMGKDNIKKMKRKFGIEAKDIKPTMTYHLEVRR